MLSPALEFIVNADFNTDDEEHPTRCAEESLKLVRHITEIMGPWCGWKIAQQQLKKFESHVTAIEWEQLFLKLGKALGSVFMAEVDTFELERIYESVSDC